MKVAWIQRISNTSERLLEGLWKRKACGTKDCLEQGYTIVTRFRCRYRDIKDNLLLASIGICKLQSVGVPLSSKRNIYSSFSLAFLRVPFSFFDGCLPFSLLCCLPLHVIISWKRRSVNLFLTDKARKFFLRLVLGSAFLAIVSSI